VPLSTTFWTTPDRFVLLEEDDGANVSGGTATLDDTSNGPEGPELFQVGDDGQPIETPSTPIPTPSSGPQPQETPVAESLVPGQQQQPVPQEPQRPHISDLLRQTGLNEDEETFFQRGLMARQQLYQNRDQLAMLQQYGGEFQEFLKAKQEEAQRQKEAERAARWSGDPIDWDDSLMQYFRQDETGNLVPVHGAPANLVERYNNSRMEEAKRLRQFARDPDGYLAPAKELWKKEILDEVRQMVTQDLLTPRDHEFAATQIVQELAPHMATVDPATGKRVATVFGQRYYDLANDFVNRFGVSDPRQIHQLVLDQIQREHAFYSQYAPALWGGGQQPAAPAAPGGVAPVQAPATSAAQSQAAKDRYVQSAARVPSQAGALHNGADGAGNTEEGLGLFERLQKSLAGLPPSDFE